MLHSKHKLSIDDKVVLKKTLEDIFKLFSCGSTLKDVKPLTDPSDSPQTKSLFELVFVRENLNCEMPLEVTYYSGVYPICSYCMDEGKENVLRERDPCLSQLNSLQKSQEMSFHQILFISFFLLPSTKKVTV